ncbi:MAG TPA: hypothetical protein PKC28_09450 [Bdellovibrionales bacterium]|nr:hypothetical protein [Bdellovibrionales bacterium]
MQLFRLSQIATLLFGLMTMPAAAELVENGASNSRSGLALNPNYRSFQECSDRLNKDIPRWAKQRKSRMFQFADFRKRIAACNPELVKGDFQVLQKSVVKKIASLYTLKCFDRKGSLIKTISASDTSARTLDDAMPANCDYIDVIDPS